MQLGSLFRTFGLPEMRLKETPEFDPVRIPSGSARAVGLRIFRGTFDVIGNILKETF
jgi:hypothetical protein